MDFGGVRLAVLAAGLVLLGLGQAELAWAAAGDVRADIRAGSPGGVSVAFDGRDLYYTDLNGTILKSVTTGGAARASVPIVGATGLNALTYDVTHDFFWAVDTTGLGVYRLSRNGISVLQFTLIPAVDLPGLCDVPLGCSTTVSGLAYDGTNDSLWYAPQNTQRVYHFNTAGQLLGYFDLNETSGSLFPDCPTNAVTGIAAGASSLYLSAGSCGRGFRYTKSNTLTASKLSTFSVAGPRAGDIECDNRTFPATVVWVRDANDGHIRAIEVPAGTCVFGGGVAIVETIRWMSGGGQQLFPGEGSHAFHLLCDPPDPNKPHPPNNLVVNGFDLFGNRVSFHLTTLTSAFCTPSDTVLGPPPPCDATVVDCFNTIIGTGEGRLRRRTTAGQIVPGTSDVGFVTFFFQDNGEPNTDDTGSIDIAETEDGEPFFHTCACSGNYQAHQRPR